MDGKLMADLYIDGNTKARSKIIDWMIYYFIDGIERDYPSFEYGVKLSIALSFFNAPIEYIKSFANT